MCGHLHKYTTTRHIVHVSNVALLILVKKIYVQLIKIKNLNNISGILNTKLDYAMFCSFRVTNGPP